MSLIRKLGWENVISVTEDNRSDYKPMREFEEITSKEAGSVDFHQETRGHFLKKSAVKCTLHLCAVFQQEC